MRSTPALTALIPLITLSACMSTPPIAPTTAAPVIPGPQATPVRPAELIPQADLAFITLSTYTELKPDSPVVGRWGEHEQADGGRIFISERFPRHGRGSAEISGRDGQSLGGLLYVLAGRDLVSLADLQRLQYDWYLHHGAAAPIFTLHLAEWLGGHHYREAAILHYMPQNEGQLTVGEWQTSDVLQGIKLWQELPNAPGGRQIRSFAQYANDPEYTPLIIRAIEVRFGRSYGNDYSAAIDNIILEGPAGVRLHTNFEP